MKFKDFKKELLKDPDFRKEYLKKDLKLEIAHMFIDARISKGITQERLAKLIGTKQSSIARIESGNYLPGLKFIEKVAQALKTDLIPPRFAFLEKSENQSFNQIIIAKIFEASDIVKEAEKLIANNSSTSASKISL